MNLVDEDKRFVATSRVPCRHSGGLHRDFKVTCGGRLKRERVNRYIRPMAGMYVLPSPRSPACSWNRRLTPPALSWRHQNQSPVTTALRTVRKIPPLTVAYRSPPPGRSPESLSICRCGSWYYYPGARPRAFPLLRTRSWMPAMSAALPA